MCRSLRFSPSILLVSLSLATLTAARGQIRDGGIDPWNLGKGDWIYSMTDATNKLGGHISSVTNENSLMLFYKSQGIRYMIVKAATSDQHFRGCYGFPQVTTALINTAHANGILLFAYNRSYGSNVVGEIALADYYFQRGADGFVFDAEAEWESSSSWIGANGPAKAWQLCSTVRSNWPTKFLAHAPFPIISFHSSFPYKEFGYWCDAVMPQIYHFSAAGLKQSISAGINWSDVNWRSWQQSLVGASSVINGQTIFWTNAIKPITPLQDVYGPTIAGGIICEGSASAYPDKDVMEFLDYCTADPHTQTVGGYRGINFWRADLHGAVQWANIKTGTSGIFTGLVNNIVMDDPTAAVTGPWTAVKVFGATTTTPTYYGATGSDTNSFGTNYLTKGQGPGTAYVQFTPNIITSGDYDVYQWHPFRADASAAVPVVISYNGGITTVYANQKTNAGNWSLLGRFNFAVGAGGSIRITDGLLDSGTVVMADGIKLVFAPSTSVPLSPSGLSASAVSTSRIDLVWIDRATNESSYVVGRGASLSGPFGDVATLGANATNYSDTGLAPETTYYYVVRAQNGAGASPNSASAWATTFPAVITPPSIDQQPQGLVAGIGQSATFTVTASGTAPIAYQWRFNGASIAGATSNSYTLAAVFRSDTGPYSVLISNAAGTALSSNAPLTVVSLVTWGNNSNGQLNVPATVSNIVAISGGAWHSLALDSSGAVFAWGNNAHGQCDVPPWLNDALAIAAGDYHSLAIRSDRSVAAWGANAYGQSTLPPSLADTIAIAAGSWHSLALRADGTVAAWGDNTWGQTNLPPELDHIVAIAAGGNHNLALNTDGLVLAWGENTDANGIFVGQSIIPTGLSNVIAISAGQYHSLAVKADGTVVAWGDNSQNQCSIPSGLSGIVALSAGAAHSVALKSDGTLVAWGADWSGQATVPAGLTNVLAVAAGGYHTLAWLDDGSFLPRLASPVWQSGQFSALLQTLPRSHYTFESKSSWADLGWTALSAVAGNGSLRLLTDTNAFPPQGFYRARQW